MRVAITGTPGTGKTSVSKKLAENLGLDYLSVNELARREGCVVSRDKKRKTDVVDVEALRGSTTGLDDCVLDGHLSHFLKNDKTFVLRCRPSVLRERLEEKGWSESKVRENVDAEILGVIQEEAGRGDEEVYSIDTTHKDVEKVVETIAEIVKGKDDKGKYLEPIDWIEKGETGD